MEEIIILLLVLTLGISIYSLLKNSNENSLNSDLDLTKIPQILQPSIQNILSDIGKLETNYLAKIRDNSASTTTVLREASQNINSSKQDLEVLRGDMGEVRKFTDKLDRNPNFKGTVGEEVVKSLLQQIPQDYVHYQYNKPDIKGKPDFVIELPNVTEKLVIDSKFVTPKENERIDKKTLDRAKEIRKYITPNITLEFVIMWVPEQVYFELKQETHVKLTDMNIVATTTGLLRPLIYLIQRFALHLRLNERASEYADFRNLIYSTIGTSNEDLDKGLKQLENGLDNIKKGKAALNSIKDDEGGDEIIDNS